LDFRAPHGPFNTIPQLQTRVTVLRLMTNTVQVARAHHVTTLCCANVLLASALCKLSQEMKAHSRLLTSHAALTRQAAGIREEYGRVAQLQESSLKEQLSMQVGT
jgi:hypothetical protein